VFVEGEKKSGRKRRNFLAMNDNNVDER